MDTELPDIVNDDIGGLKGEPLLSYYNYVGPSFVLSDCITSKIKIRIMVRL